MDALGSGGFWLNFPRKGRRHCSRRRRNPKSSSSASSSESLNLQQGSASGWSLSDFPLKQSAIASALRSPATPSPSSGIGFPSSDDLRPMRTQRADNASVLWSDHDWLRSLRMASYGFLLYGPGSYAWYQFLDRSMPKQTFINLSTKVLLNQIVLGPCVIAVIFAWNNLWLGKLSDLPNKYRKDALPTLLYGFRFWIPISILNFGVVPFSTRVAFMSTASIFWNFYLSSTLSK